VAETATSRFAIEVLHRVAMSAAFSQKKKLLGLYMHSSKFKSGRKRWSLIHGRVNTKNYYTYSTSCYSSQILFFLTILERNWASISILSFAATALQV
jgi:hypothetical protein